VLGEPVGRLLLSIVGMSLAKGVGANEGAKLELGNIKGALDGFIEGALVGSTMPKITSLLPMSTTDPFSIVKLAR
jgi:hypothetical protein